MAQVEKLSSSLSDHGALGNAIEDDHSDKHGTKSTRDASFVIKFKRRKVSVVRDLPIGCGQFAKKEIPIEHPDHPTTNKLELLPSVSPGPIMPSNDSDLIKLSKQQNPAHDFCPYRRNPRRACKEGCAKTIASTRKESRVGKKKSVDEPMSLDDAVKVESGEVNLVRKSSKQITIIPSRGEKCTSSEFPAARLVVQALMATPNCPWTKGKQLLNSNKTPRASSAGNRLKKGKLAVDHYCLQQGEEKDEDISGRPEGLNIPFDSTVSDLKNDYPRESNPGGGFRDVSGDPESCSTPSDFIDFDWKNDDHPDTNPRGTVRETIRLFQACCRRLLKGEESKSKGRGQTIGQVGLKASMLMKVKNKWINTGKPILGPIPGVEVGDEFHFRVELVIIGLHRQHMAGIDYLKENKRILATSIVASGRYDDVINNSDLLIYSGHGGNPGNVDKKAEDQKLERGNLALKNSMDAQIPVRVIRGFKEKKASDIPGGKAKLVATYTYDGLYLVEDYWTETRHYGFSVFKFRLRRIPGQPELALREVKRSNKSTIREGICVQDISEGKEKLPICAVNTIDDERPPTFKYITKMIYPSWYNPIPPKGCDCSNGCSDTDKCMCAVKNGGEIPFNHDCAIVEAKSLVYECGPSCSCPPSCHNRVSQHGIKFQLEIFKTKSRGWGVRSLNSIPSGSFICEYTGELLQDTEAERRTGNDDYLFDVGQNYNDHSLWAGLSTVVPDLQTNQECEVVEDLSFTIDAAGYGNVGKFINHSCSPNLYAQNVLYDHEDKRLPHIMLFASENIPPLQELTYHYNYEIDQVRDSKGNIKTKACYCGSHECTGRLY